MRKVLLIGLAASLMAAMSAHVIGAERVVTVEQYPAHLDAGLVGLQDLSPVPALRERMCCSTPVVVAYELFTTIIQPNAPKEVAHGQPASITPAHTQPQFR
jgi:hypothetical protein